MRMLIALPAIVLAVSITATSSTSATKVLRGTVGPGFTISLKKSGTAVKTLKPGKYSLVVTDKSRIHNFRLKGPGGVNKATSIVRQGISTYALTLVKGTYTFVCDPHVSSMKGTFKVQ